MESRPGVLREADRLTKREDAIPVTSDPSKFLKHKGHTWQWSRFHKWADRSSPPVRELGLITEGTKVFGMGSCFADHVVRYLSREMGVDASSFEESRFYDPVSVLQTVKHFLVEPQYDRDDLWVTSEGLHGNPFRNTSFRAASYDELRTWTDAIEASAARRLRHADVIIITLGGTETWRNPRTLKTYITIPFPDVFNAQMPGIAEFHNLSFSECYAALEEMYRIIRATRPQAHIIMTVSPVRLTFTVTGKDVTVATSQSKSTLRAAAGELTDRFSDHLHYFQSYEIVGYAPAGTNFFTKDDIHVTDVAVAVVMNQFAREFVSSALRAASGYELVQAMIRDGNIAQLESVKRPDLRYGVIRVLRSIGMEKMALRVYQRLRNR